MIIREVIKSLRTDRTEIGLKNLPTWTDIGLAPIGFAVYLILAVALTQLLVTTKGQASTIPMFTSSLDGALYFINVVVLIPIAEEIIFRGWLYGKLRQLFLSKLSDAASMVVSTAIVSLLFGFLHGEWSAAINMFSMSVILCGMREITGTIYSGTLMHILKNAVAFCVIMFA